MDDETTQHPDRIESATWLACLLFVVFEFSVLLFGIFIGWMIRGR